MRDDRLARRLGPSRCLGRTAAVHKLSMFRLRTVVLLWLGRKVWSIVWPALQRRLRARSQTSA